MRDIQTPTTDDRGNEQHPAFGLATVTRGTSNGGTALFQSDITHQHTMTLAIHEADRRRDLSQDWTHPGREIVEIEMSLAQWGELVSSIGLGSGTPCTIRRRHPWAGDARIPLLPFQPRTAESLEEVRRAADETFAKVRDAAAEVEEAIEQKQGIRALRAAARSLRIAVAGASNNTVHVVTQLSRAAESVVSQAKADIEAHALAAQRRTEIQQAAQIEPPHTADLTRGLNA